jgi:hypothetical protein
MAIDQDTKAYLLGQIGAAFPGADDLAEALSPQVGTTVPSTDDIRFVGDKYIKTDTNKVYVATAAGTWTILN